MVTWSDDVNLERICEGINKYISHYKMKDYYIFGLQQEDRPHVKVSPSCPDSLKELFVKSGYILEVKEINEKYCDSCDERHYKGNCCCGANNGCSLCTAQGIMIGLRRDVRNDVKTARKLIKTIIFGMENKLVLKGSSKLSLGRRVKKVTAKKGQPVEVKKPTIELDVDPTDSNAALAFATTMGLPPLREVREVTYSEHVNDDFNALKKQLENN